MTVTGRVSRREQEALAEEQLLGQTGKTRSRIMKAIATERHAAVPISAVTPNPQQPRTVFDESALEELASTIRIHGLQQEIVVEQPDEMAEQYVLIAGERRWRAFRMLAAQPATADFDPADFERIPAVIRQVRSDSPARTRAILALIENVVREDLSPRERAAAFNGLKTETGWSWDQIARHLGLDPARVKKLASLDGQGPLLDALDRGDVTQNQAFALARLRDKDLLGALLPAVKGATEFDTQALIHRVKELREQGEGEQVKSAIADFLGVPIIGRASPTRRHSFPLRTGATTAPITVDMVELRQTPLRQVLRRREIERETLASILQATCEQLDIWPVRP